MNPGTHTSVISRTMKHSTYVHLCTKFVKREERLFLFFPFGGSTMGFTGVLLVLYAPSLLPRRRLRLLRLRRPPRNRSRSTCGTRRAADRGDPAQHFGPAAGGTEASSALPVAPAKGERLYEAHHQSLQQRDMMKRKFASQVGEDIL